MAGKIFESVEVPHGLDEKQAEWARNYVKGRTLEGLTIEQTCKKYGMNTGTLYNDKHLKNIVFQRYVNALTAILATDEIGDFQMIANQIKQDALRPNSTHKDRELYLKVFDWLVEYNAEIQKAKYGLESKVTTEEKTLEERKSALFAMRSKHTKGDRK